MRQTDYKLLSSLVYDLTKPPKTSIDGDVEFYLKQSLKDLGLALEAGVGNGRMAIPLLRSGINVIGLDSSSEMLELYKKIY